MQNRGFQTSLPIKKTNKLDILKLLIKPKWKLIEVSRHLQGKLLGKHETGFV